MNATIYGQKSDLHLLETIEMRPGDYPLKAFFNATVTSYLHNASRLFNLNQNRRDREFLEIIDNRSKYRHSNLSRDGNEPDRTFESCILVYTAF